jgi:uncharacterized membrane protein
MPSTDRALGTLGKLVLGSVAFLAALVVAGAILAVVQNIIAALLGLLVTGLLFGAVAYAAYWLLSSLLGSDEPTDRSTDVESTAPPADPVERLTERYKRGEISEAEFERRLEQEMRKQDDTDVDRELADLERELE